MTEQEQEGNLARMDTTGNSDDSRTAATVWALPPSTDEDIPVDVKRELMRCATANGRISYYYLCDVWRRGREAGKADVVRCWEGQAAHCPWGAKAEGR